MQTQKLHENLVRGLVLQKLLLFNQYFFLNRMCIHPNQNCNLIYVENRPLRHKRIFFLQKFAKKGVVYRKKESDF